MNTLLNEEEYPQLSERAIRAYFTADINRRIAFKKTAIAIGLCFAVLVLGWLISLLLNLTMDFSYPAQINFLGIFMGIVILLFGALAIQVVGKLNAHPFSDQDYDLWLEGTVQKHFVRALDRSDVDDNQDFGPVLYVHGFILPGTRDASKFRPDDIHIKACKDGKFRYSINRYTFFHPIENQLLVLTFDVNAVNHADYRETIKEFFYWDIVSVAIEDDQDTVLDYAYRIQSFALSTSDGKSVSAAFRSLPLDNKQNLPTYDIPDANLVDDTIMRLRRLIRFNKRRQSSQDL